MTRPRVCALTLAVLLAGCSAPSSPSLGMPTTKESAAPVAAEPAASGHGADAVSGEPVGSIADGSGDAAGRLDLLGATLTRSGGDLIATWTLAAPLPTSGAAGLFIEVTTPNGDTGGQLGVTYAGGKRTGQFVLIGAASTPVTGTATASGTTVRASFPVAALASMGTAIRWRATVTADQKDSDFAPDPGESMLDPKTLPFTL